MKILGIIILEILIVLIMLFAKYKTAYEVTISEEKVGYIGNLEDFENLIEEQVIEEEEKNIASIAINEEPQYEKKLVKRNINFNEAEIIEKIKNEDTTKTYKYYEVSLNDETKAKVDTLDEAEEIINQIKSEFDGNDLELNLQVNEKYTSNKEEIETKTLEVASSEVEQAVQKIKEENEAIAVINDVKISVLPVTGKITSRYGESSRLRSSTHTGLDIACATGTNIKVAASGTVTFAAYNGSYGNLVKVDHGNGIETWYGHCSKLYAKVGQKVTAGDVIAAVGSTGNSTGPHLHFEIRINGNTVNPQKYVY